jgi:hypothetical protein
MSLPTSLPTTPTSPHRSPDRLSNHTHVSHVGMCSAPQPCPRFRPVAQSFGLAEPHSATALKGMEIQDLLSRLPRVAQSYAHRRNFTKYITQSRTKISNKDPPTRWQCYVVVEEGNVVMRPDVRLHVVHIKRQPSISQSTDWIGKHTMSIEYKSNRI